MRETRYLVYIPECTIHAANADNLARTIRSILSRSGWAIGDVAQEMTIEGQEQPRRPTQVASGPWWSHAYDGGGAASAWLKHVVFPVEAQTDSEVQKAIDSVYQDILFIPHGATRFADNGGVEVFASVKRRSQHFHEQMMNALDIPHTLRNGTMSIPLLDADGMLERVVVGMMLDRHLVFDASGTKYAFSLYAPMNSWTPNALRWRREAGDEVGIAYRRETYEEWDVVATFSPST